MVFGFFSRSEENDIPTPLDAGAYIVRNRTSGTVMEVAETRDHPAWKPRAKIQASPKTEPFDLKQCWFISAYRDAKYVTFLNSRSSTYIDLDDGSSKNGTKCNAYPLAAKFPKHGSNVDAAREWLATRTDDGYWRFKNRASGTYLEINDGSSVPGTAVQAWSGNEKVGAQQWELIPAPPNIIAGTLFVPIEKWMSAVPDEKLVSQLTIPGTHESGSVEPNSPVQFQENYYRWTTQLSHGIRSFDLSTWYDHSEDHIEGVYGTTDQSWTYAGFQSCVERFLADHPSEVVFAHVTINAKEGDDFKSQKVYTKEYAEKWWNSMFQNINRSSQLYARNHGGSYEKSTIGSLRGKLVLVVNDYNIPGAVKPIFDWSWPTVKSTMEEPNEASGGEAWEQTGPAVKWNKVQNVLLAALADSSQEGFYHSELNTGYQKTSNTRRQVAFELNCFLDDFLRLKAPGATRLGFIHLDFYHMPSNLVGDLIAKNPFTGAPN